MYLWTIKHLGCDASKHADALVDNKMAVADAM